MKELINKLQKIFQTIAGWGTSGVDSIYETRRIRLTNYYLLISIFSTVAYRVLYLFQDIEQLWAASLLTDIFILFFISGLFFSKYGKYLVARYIFSLGTFFVMLSVTGIYFGSQPHIHFYFLLFAAANVIVWDFRYLKPLLLFLVLNLAGFIYIEIIKSDNMALILFPKNEAKIIAIISIVSTFVTTIIIIGLYRFQVFKSEITLEEQALDLKSKNEVILLQKKEIEEDIETLHLLYNELKLKSEEIKITNKKLQDINATKDRFFSIIAHDLKNPIGNFSNILDLILEDNTSNSIRQNNEILQVMKISASGIHLLLDNLLEWSLSQAGEIKYNPDFHDIPKLIKNNINLIKLNAFSKNISVEFESDDDISAYFDMNMINTVIRNLISNALKFTPSGGKIKLSVLPTEKDIVISVSDTGVGIAEDDLVNLFNQDNLTSQPGTNREKGTGLGLILCKEFVEKNNGRLRVESIIGEGTTFIFTLPTVIT